MNDLEIIFCTCPTEAEAERIAQALVNERLAACVNILPGIRSIYRWQNAVEEAREHLLLIKSTSARCAALRERIIALHSYDTPEIIVVPIADGSEKYLAWIREQV